MVDERAREVKTGREMNHATNGMTENAVKRKRTAEGCISATNAGREGTEGRTVRNELAPKCPKYFERSVWTDADSSPVFSPMACCTLVDKLLPRPSPEELSKSEATTTIRDNPQLFKIVTPINVLKFEELLVSHPNKPFIESICTSLHEGFWPWANTQKDKYPITWDFSEHPPKTECEADFLRDQRDVQEGTLTALGLTYCQGCTVLQFTLYPNPGQRSYVLLTTTVLVVSH